MEIGFLPFSGVTVWEFLILFFHTASSGCSLAFRLPSDIREHSIVEREDEGHLLSVTIGAMTGASD